MTSPVERIEVECPACGETYSALHRASLNLDLDDFTDDEIRDAATATCPSCGRVVELSSLVVDAGVWRFTTTREEI